MAVNNLTDGKYRVQTNELKIENTEVKADKENLVLKKSPTKEIPSTNGFIADDFTSRNRSQFLNKLLDTNQNAVANNGNIKTPINAAGDEIDVNYLKFVMANDLEMSPESLQKYNDMKVWLDGKSKPVSPLPKNENLRESYNAHRRNYKLPDTEELRQKFITGFEKIKNGQAERIFTDEESKFLESLKLERENPQVTVKTEQTVSVRVQVSAPNQTNPNQATNSANNKDIIGLSNGETLKLSKDQENVREGFERFESKNGEKWLVDRVNEKLINEGDLVETDIVEVKLLPASERFTTSVAIAKEMYINQVADNLSKKYDGNTTVDNPDQLNLPFSDVKAWMQKSGIADLKTDQTLTDDEYYASPGKDGTTYHLTNGDLKELTAYSNARRQNLEDAYLGIITSGRELTAEEQKFFADNQLTPESVANKRFADLELAKVKGNVRREDFERFRTEELGKSDKDETIATLNASKRVGWITKEQLDKGLEEYNGFKNKIIDSVYKDLVQNYGRSQVVPGGLNPSAGRLPQRSDITQADINGKIEELRSYELSPDEKNHSQHVAEFYNNLLGDYGSSALGGLLNAGGRGWQTVAGVLRIAGLTEPAAYLSRTGTGMLLAADQMGDNKSYISSGIKMISGGVLDIPRLVILSDTPLGMIGGFAISSGLESNGRGDTPTTAIRETAKGGALGALFLGAGNLSKSVVNRTFFKNAPKELTTGLSAADRNFLEKVAFDAKGLPNKTYQQAIISKVLGESTRVGTIFGGTVAIEKAGGATTDEAFANAAKMLIFDLVMHHGGKGITKLKSESFDRIRNKQFRVVANGESKIVSINAKNEIVTYDKLNKLSKAEQDKIIDATLVAKNDLNPVKTEPTKVEPIELTQNGSVYGKYVKGEYLEITSPKKKPQIFGGDKIILDAKKTTTITGILDNVDSIAFRGRLADGATKMGENLGGINILRSPLWNEIKQKHISLKSTNEIEYWKKVTDEFWEKANKPWLNEAIKRGDSIRFVSDPLAEKNLFVTDKKGKIIFDNNGNKIRSIFGREVDYLQSKGYVILADGTAVRK